MKKNLSIVLLLAALLSADAQSTKKPTAEQLARFFDAAVPAMMEELHIAGAVVGITDGSRTLFLRGYGSADVEERTAVEPETILFRAGSISKLFTWTAIMQLEEQGRLDLHDPVEKYLDFELPDTFDRPIRIIDLMNHTPGFEDRLIGLMVQEEKYRLSLKQAVSRDIPRRVRPPGVEVSYSNYGTMLAGYIVQRLSGMPYEEYVETYILQPLGLDRSTFRQPPPPHLAEHLATAYTYEGGQYVAQRFEIVNGAPAGALSTTAEDMLRFYRAYLNEGQLNGTRILKSETVRRMREPSFRHDPRANGFAHGFFELGHGEVKVFGHGGDTIFFHSISGYLPEEDLAYFVSTNSASGMELTLKLQDQMFDEFFPVPSGSELAEAAGLDPDLQEYTGVFAMNRRSESDPTQLMGAVSLVRPKISEDGQGLRIASILDPEGSVYVPVAEDIFQQQAGRMRIVFLRNDRGTVQSLYAHDFPAFLFSRPPWIETPAVSIAVLILGLLFLLTGSIAPPTGLLTLIPRLRPKNGAAAMRACLWSARAYLLLFVLEFVLTSLLGNIIVFVPIGPVHGIPLYLAAAAVVLVLACAVQSWRKKYFRLFGRLHYSAFAVSQALLIAWLGYWGFFFV